MIKISNGNTSSSLFSGGEINIKVNIDNDDPVDVDIDLKSSNDIMSLMLACDAINRNGNDLRCLRIGYLAYGRQDRIFNEGEALGLSVVAKMINSLGFKRVEILDPHSNATLTAIDNSVEVFPEWNHYIGPDSIVLNPDSGGYKRSLHHAKSLNLPMISAVKIRDPSNGVIIHTEIMGNVHGKNVHIFDDICDGGRTFEALAVAAKKQGAKSVHLCVTHGIFSRGTEILLKSIDTIKAYK